MKHKEGTPPKVPCAYCRRTFPSKFAKKRHQELCKDNPVNAIHARHT
jgi:hypothetical protein